MTAVTTPTPLIDFSAWCERVAGAGWACMVCTGPGLTPATGHAVAADGPHRGRLLALLCGYHAALPGAGDVAAEMERWAQAGLITGDLGPGPRGVPGVLHREPGDAGWHLDPLPPGLTHDEPGPPP
jgi:hypothetical protein